MIRWPWRLIAVAIVPLIRQVDLSCLATNQCWFANDDGVGADLVSLRRYWDELLKSGPDYGYFPNASKTVLVVKPQHHDEVHHLFSDTGIKIR